MDKSQYIGITETSDPCFHLEIFDNLYEGNIIVTKNLTDKLIEKLIEHHEKCILHFTVTGMGGSKIEPLVPSLETSVKKFKKLIDGGFPVNQVVLRIDPIVPTSKGIETAVSVLEAFKGFGIERVRISFLDMYDHVKDRFYNNHINLPYESFHASEVVRNDALTKVWGNAMLFGFKSIETCGEPGFKSRSCISQMDIDILGLTDKIKLEGNKEQRTHCGCPANKKQLIKGKPHRCEHQCLYCFWKEE